MAARLTKAQRAANLEMIVYGKLAESIEGNYKMEQLRAHYEHAAHCAAWARQQWSNACGWSNEARLKAQAAGLI